MLDNIGLLDNAFEAYFTHKYFDGHSPSIGRNAMVGYLLLRRPGLAATAFVKAKRAMKGWNAKSRGVVGKPCPEQAMMLIAKHFADDNSPLLAGLVCCSSTRTCGPARR